MKPLTSFKAHIPEYPVGTAEDVAKMIAEFTPIARTLIGLSKLKIITFFLIAQEKIPQ